MGTPFNDLQEFSDFTDRFYDNLLILQWRLNRFGSLDQNTVDYLTFYDAILTQIRALFIENEREKNNYTVQVFLKKIGMDTAAKEIDQYLSGELSDGLSIRDSIKTSVDKFIVHYDRVTVDHIRIEEICRKHLCDKKGKNYIGKIVNNTVVEMVHAQINAMSKGIIFLAED